MLKIYKGGLFMKSYTQRSMSHELAKLFVKYDFFNDDRLVDCSYGILLEVYFALPIEIQDQIRSDFYLLKSGSAEI